MALIIFVQPGWARESSRRQDGRGTADKSRTQSVKPAEKNNNDRSGRDVSNQPTIPEPRHWLGNENRQTSDRPAGREFNFSKPDMRVERNNPGIQKNIAVGNEKFDNSSLAQTEQETFEKIRSHRDFTGNRMSANPPSAAERGTTLSPSETSRLGKIINVRTPPTPVAERRSRENIVWADTADRAKDNINASRIDSSRSGSESKRPAHDNRTKIVENIDTHTAAPVSTTEKTPDTGARKHQLLQQAQHEGGFTATDKGSHGRRMDNQRREHADVKVVDSIRSQRTGESRGDGHFGDRHFGDDRHFRDRDRDGESRRIISATRNDFVFFDRRHFVNHRIVRPDFFFLLDFSFGPWNSFYPVYPYYHRGYLFVNPCGYWPYDYDYMRYYWYGCYPYNWYGYNPVPYQYGSSDTYNYYTYNYYSSSTGQPTGSAYDNQPVDQTALANAQQQAKPPAPTTSADNYFDEGVKAFGDGDYNAAAQKFALAKQLAPEDKVLTFAYSQAFFAAGNYTQAAAALREALAKVNPETEGVFYPRGLYSSDDVLIKQIDALSETAVQNTQDANLQLLLGYHQLGIGELDKAASPLKQAAADQANGPAANALMKLLDKLQAAKTETPKN
jgi:hypothetical protein